MDGGIEDGEISEKGSRFPLLLPAMGLILGILLVSELALSAGVLGLILLIWEGFHHRWARFWVLILCVLLGGLRAHWDRERPIPGELFRKTRTMELAIDRSTEQQYQKSRRVHGFGKILSMKGMEDRQWGQAVYYNLEMPPGMPIPQQGQRARVRAMILGTAHSSRDFEHYLATTRIFYLLERGKVLAVLPGSSSFLLTLRERSRQSLAIGIDPSLPRSHIYGAMLLGNRSAMDAEEKKIYSRVGIAHLFAISGLHIGIIATFLHGLLRGFIRSRLLHFLLRTLVLLIFVEMTGGSASAFRAFSMVTTLSLAPLCFRRSSASNSLPLAAVLDLLFRPADLFATGFQLSYGVVFFLLFYGVPLGRRCRRFLPFAPIAYERQPRWKRFCRRICIQVGELWCLSIGATLPLVPLSIYHFRTFSIGGILLNPLVIPVSSLPIVAGFVSICFGFLHLPFLCGLCNLFAAIPLSLIHHCAAAVDQLSWIESPPIQLGIQGAFIWTVVLFWGALPSRGRPHPLKFLLPPILAVLPLVFL
jgi:competence protein ComEC